MTNFTLDPFQTKAIEIIEKRTSVLVSAPTGSGKTVIAEAAIETALKHSQHVIYTAPIKALSNQKFRDFRALYSNRVGIVTGDVSINPNAEILIMTTEIYRNCLFENSERIKKIGWVIFDEIHYLDDRERGTVWEEAIMFTPPETQILALSATVPNVRQLAQWMREIRKSDIEIVEESQRPVPLHFLYQCQGQIIMKPKELFLQGYLNRDNWKLSRQEKRRGMHRFYRAKPNRLDTMLYHLKQNDRLPVVYFAFGRRRTEYLAWEAAERFDFLDAREKEKIKDMYERLLARYDLLSEKSALDMGGLIELGIAHHHAGMLPTLKEVVEQLFTSRMIKLIFTTETFALGINMPARSVIFDEVEKYYDTGFRVLTTRDFYQMAGRAGRRSLDKEGHVYIRVNPLHISYSELFRVIEGDPEPIRSQLNATYATLLNLYRTLGERLVDIYPRTFHFFQSNKKRRSGGLDLIKNKLEMLREMRYLDENGLTPKGEFASTIFGYELYLGEMYFDRVLEGLNEIQLTSLLSGLIYEPRKGDRAPKPSERHKKIVQTAEHYGRLINRKELKYRVRPHTKLVHFNLLPVVEAWSAGATFDRLFRDTSADEGGLVRHFRMIIQLLREIRHAPQISDGLRATSENAMKLINRDVVDAERQLRA